MHHLPEAVIEMNNEENSLILNRRMLKRRTLIYYLKVFDRKAEKLLGVIGDINADGLMVICDEPIERGQDFELELVLPKTLEDDILVFDASSCWCGMDEDQIHYAIGFQYRNLPDDALGKIGHIISRYGFKD